MIDIEMVRIIDYAQIGYSSRFVFVQLQAVECAILSAPPLSNFIARVAFGCA
jgi:hypothetical protein